MAQQGLSASQFDCELPFTELKCAPEKAAFTLCEGNIIPNRSIILQVRISHALSHCEQSRQAGAKISHSGRIKCSGIVSTMPKTFTAIGGTLPKRSQT